MRCIGLALVALSLAFAPTARALTLQDLDAGASFSSSDGSLTFLFDPGSIVRSGALPADLTAYLVTPIAGGFQIDGPLVAANGAFGSLSLAYQVSAGAGLLLEGASLLVAGVAFGPSALSLAGETLSNGAGLGVLVSGAGGGSPVDAAGFAATPSLDVVTGAQLLAFGAGEVASIQALRQTFSLVAIPEIETGLLLGLGLLGLAICGDPPRRRSAARIPLRRRG